MQQIILISESPREYALQGRNYPFEVPDRCPYPDCLIPIPLKKHGFYERYLISIGFYGKIPIRRYYCPYCGRTVSYLPSFCLPYYQYSLIIIYLALLGYFQADHSKTQILNGINCSQPIELPYYGLKTYSPKTLMKWLSDYRHGGLDAFKPGYRSDRGQSRKKI